MTLVVALLGPVMVLAAIWLGIGIEDPWLFLLFAIVVGLVLWRLPTNKLVSASASHPLANKLAMGAAVVVFPLTQLDNAVWIRVAATGAIFAALAVGLNIVVGRAGLLDLGYAAFFGIGAYTGALLSDCSQCPVSFHVPFLVALLASGLIGALFGVLLGFPVLRLRGDYLAIVTLGFGEIIRIALNNLDDVPFANFNLTNGPNGLFGVGHPVVFGYDFGNRVSLFGRDVPNVINYYYLMVLFTVVMIFVVNRMKDSRIGRAWTAVREDEQAAQAMGINTTVAKLLAFATGAFFGGLAGNLFVHLQTGASPEDFGFLVSITVLAMVVLGGIGNVYGVVVGGLLLIAVPEKLRFVSDYRFLLFGLVLVLMMRLKPAGLMPERK